MKKRIIAVLLVVTMVFLLAGCDSMDYKEAMELYDAGRYSAAEAIFLELEDYEDSAEMAKRCRYMMAKDLYREGDYKGAAAMFSQLGRFEDSKEMARKANFQIAREFVLDNGEYIDGGYMATYAYGGAIVGLVAYEDDEDTLLLVHYTETNILAEFTYTTSIILDCTSDEAGLEAEHDMFMYYSGSYASSDWEYEGNFSVSQFTRDSRITLTDYYEYSVNIYGYVTTEDDVDEAPVEDLHTHIYDLIDGINSYLESENTGITVQDLGFDSWE